MAKNDLTRAKKSCLTMSQLRIKKFTLNPSGLGLLFFFIDFKVFHISSSVTSLSSIRAWEGLIKCEKI